jgi:hypothetical protein
MASVLHVFLHLILTMGYSPNYFFWVYRSHFAVEKTEKLRNLSLVVQVVIAKATVLSPG